VSEVSGGRQLLLAVSSGVMSVLDAFLQSTKLGQEV
jgi:hypothetical protein